MVDTVKTNVIQSNTRRHVVYLGNLSDGTGESTVTKVDISGLTDLYGNTPLALDLEFISWSCSGMAAQLLWNHSTNDEMMMLNGNGEIDYRPYGLLKDPRTDDTGDATNGDVLLTTAGHTANDTYNILLSLRLRPDSD